MLVDQVVQLEFLLLLLNFLLLLWSDLQGLIVFHDQVLELLEGARQQELELFVEAGVQNLDQLAKVLVILFIRLPQRYRRQIWSDDFLEDDVWKRFVRRHLNP